MNKKRTRLWWDKFEERTLLSATPPSLFFGPIAAGYSTDGSGNNLKETSWGAADIDLLRIAASAYSDGLSAPAGTDRPSPREISNVIADQGSEDTVNSRFLSAMAYAWGQFIDHDLDHTLTGSPAESMPILVPIGDPSFDPTSTGTQEIPFSRSAYDPTTGSTDPREQINSVTAWIDGSMIYGSDADRAAALRTFQGGRLKTGIGDLLPTNDSETFPGGPLAMDIDAHLVPDDQLFAAGDVRANENIELTSMQTLFVREHNYWADKIAASDASLTDEQIYQQARAIVIAEIQSITFNQWLPALLGPNAISQYSGYDPSVNPGITTEFSTAAMRIGHSMLGNDVEFLDNNGKEIRPAIELDEAFTNPDLIRQNGIDPLLKYLASDPSSEIDTKVVDSLRNYLFGEPGSGGMDLASMNIQRGRDHGLADYNTVREALGLPRVTSFSEITSDVKLQSELESLYGSVDNIDLWVGGLAEDHVPGGSVGPTFRAIIVDQFTRLRDGDRFWYQRVFSGASLQRIEQTSLSDIIMRNTVINNIQRNPFLFQAGISGTVFSDSNGDGRRQPLEAGVIGQVVQLTSTQDHTVISTTVTDQSGRYQFGIADGLRTGTYQIQVISDANGITPLVFASSPIGITSGNQFVGRVDFSLSNAESEPAQGMDGTPPRADCSPGGGTYRPESDLITATDNSPICPPIATQTNSDTTPQPKDPVNPLPLNNPALNGIAISHVESHQTNLNAVGIEISSSALNSGSTRRPTIRIRRQFHRHHLFRHSNFVPTKATAPSARNPSRERRA